MESGRFTLKTFIWEHLTSVEPKLSDVADLSDYPPDAAIIQVKVLYERHRSEADEFYALAVACKGIPKRENPIQDTLGPGGMLFAIHGRLGAQVALLQSPILPAVRREYSHRSNKTNPEAH